MNATFYGGGASEHTLTPPTYFQVVKTSQQPPGSTTLFDYAANICVVMLSVKAGPTPQQQIQQAHLHMHQQQQQQQLAAAEMASRRNLASQQFIENELAKIQQEKLRIQRQQETLAQKVMHHSTATHHLSHSLSLSLSLSLYFSTFYPRDALISAAFAVVRCPSVRLSVYLSHVSILSKWLNLSENFF